MQVESLTLDQIHFKHCKRSFHLHVLSRDKTFFRKSFFWTLPSTIFHLRTRFHSSNENFLQPYFVSRFSHPWLFALSNFVRQADDLHSDAYFKSPIESIRTILPATRLETTLRFIWRNVFTLQNSQFPFCTREFPFSLWLHHHMAFITDLCWWTRFRSQPSEMGDEKALWERSNLSDGR